MQRYKNSQRFDSLVETSMPALQALIDTLKNEFGDDFAKLAHKKNTLLVIVQHGFATIRSLMEAIFSLGIDRKKQVMVITKPHTTPAAMLDYFYEQLGSNYMVFEWPKETNPGEGQTPYQRASEQSLRALFNKVCDYLLRYPGPSEIDNVIICDEGGKLLPFFIEGYRHPDSRYDKKLSDYRIIGVEHTKCGLYREEIGRLPFPIINMADSYAKTKVEAEFIAKSMFVNIQKKIKTITESSMLVIGVIGGGNVGSELLNFLSKSYPTITILFYDKMSGVLPQAKLAEKGWHNVRRVSDAKAIFTQATVIMGCTGKDITHKAYFENTWLEQNPNPHIHCMSASSGDREFYSLLQAMPDYRLQGVEDIRDWILSLSETKQLTIYNGGFPINFIVGEPENISILEIQLTRSMKLAAIVQAFKLLEVMMYQPKQARIIKLDAAYQYVIVVAFYANLIQHVEPSASHSSETMRSYEENYRALKTDPENAHKLIQEASIGDAQPTLSDVVGIPYYVKTQYHAQAEGLIASQTTTIKRLAITGTAGSGKTVLGQYMLTRFGKQHGALTRTLIAETSMQWRSALRMWATELNPMLNELLKEIQNPDEQNKKIIQIIQYSLSTQFWCILVDNWDQEQLSMGEIEKVLLPREKTLHEGVVIMTTQGQSPFKLNCSLDVSQGFQIQESRELLHKAIDSETSTPLLPQETLGTDIERDALLGILNCLPLATVQAGCYIYWENAERYARGETVFTYADYQTLLQIKLNELLESHHQRIENKADVPREPDSEYQEFRKLKTQEAAVTLSLNKAIQPDSDNPNMGLWHMLCFCGFLASDGIPQQLLKDYLAQILSEDIRKSAEVIFEEILRKIQKYSLLQFENRQSAVDQLHSLHMHRVIQKVLQDNYWTLLLKTRSSLENTSFELSEEALHKNMCKAMLLKFSEALGLQYFDVIREYSSHVEVSLQQSLFFITIEKKYLVIKNTELQGALAKTKYLVGDYKTAEKLYRANLAIQKAYYGTLPNHNVNMTQTDLANTLLKLGIYTETEILLREALKNTIAACGTKENHDVAMIQHILANTITQLCRYEEAEILYREALITISTLYYNLSATQGERYVGLSCISEIQQSLGALLQLVGRYVEAEVFHRKTLEMKKNFYGTKAHISVADAQVNLANTLERLKRYREAEILHREALATMISHFGTKQHVKVAEVQQNLSNSLLRLNSNEEAVELCREAVKTKISHYGTTIHYEVAITQQNLANNLLILEQYEEAETLFQEALETKIIHYGTTSNVDVAMSKHSLACAKLYLKKFSLAFELVAQSELIFTTQVEGKQYLEVCHELKQRIINAQDNEGLNSQQKSIKNSETNLSNLFLLYKSSNPDQIIRRAAGEGHFENLVIFLKKYPELLNAVDKNPTKGWTALHWAIFKNHLNCALALLDRGARYDIQDKTINAATAIDILIEKSNLRMTQAVTKYIIKKYVKTNDLDAEKALRITAGSGDFFAVKLLFSQGVNIDARGPESGKTALHQATQKNHSIIVKFLINAKANTQIEDSFGRTAIDYVESNEKLIDIFRLSVESYQTSGF